MVKLDTLVIENVMSSRFSLNLNDINISKTPSSYKKEKFTLIRVLTFSSKYPHK